MEMRKTLTDENAIIASSDSLGAMQQQPDLRLEFDRLLLVFSDVEMGAGGDEDVFPHSEFLGDLLTSYLDGPAIERPIDIVFNGDTFDLLKTPYMGAHPHHITNDVAMAKMAAVAAAHPKFFGALSQILNHPSGNNRVHFVVGNHDSEILFPEVQGMLQTLCGNSEATCFPGFELAIGPVYMEHGCQPDAMFRIDPEKPFLEKDGQKFLNLSWATVALLDVYIPHHEIFYFHDLLKPRSLLMEMIPQSWEALVALGWRYWTKDFWHGFIRLKDPLLKVNWSVIKEIFKRFATGNADVGFNEDWLVEKVEKAPYDVYVTGHRHQMGSFYHGTKLVLQSGAFRDEYFIMDEGRSFRPMLKPYYEIYLKAGRVVQIVTREILGPPRPPEWFPESIYAVVPKIEKALDQLGDRAKDKESQKRQEQKEAEMGKN